MEIGHVTEFRKKRVSSYYCNDVDKIKIKQKKKNQTKYRF